MNSSCPRLIEIALPIREISAESVRDKSLRHGHISTLHLWWARRPLAASRAVVFASLVPDPDHPDCPVEFRNAVQRLLKDEIRPILKGYRRGRIVKNDPDPYRPYENIPDTLRNRLLTFIAKWSPEWLAFERGKSGKQPPPAEMLDDRCLVKWETSNPNNEQGQEILNIARQLVLIANDGKTPTLLDPFAGGGAIPLEATRLGCQAIANDYNPVAYLILRATCEFPQKFGKPGKRIVERNEFGKTIRQEIEVDNVLAYDVEYWAKWILERARQKIGNLYPPGKDRMPIVGYLWCRTVPCSNPSCRAEIPLLRSLLICNKDQKRVALTINQVEKQIDFGIAKDHDIHRTEGTAVDRGARCPICNQITPVQNIKQASFENLLGERLTAIITDTPNGKEYRKIEADDLLAVDHANGLVREVERPNEPMPNSPDTVAGRGWNFKVWGDLFNSRQILALQTFVESLHLAKIEFEKIEKNQKYCTAVSSYLGIWVSRIAQRSSSFGLWHTSGEKIECPFGRQAIPMVWDYPETNPFNEATGGALGQLDWILRIIKHESNYSHITTLPSIVFNGDGALLPLEENSIDVGITDPPYFDAIAYADLSDYFYIWLKRSLGDEFPEAFSTPLTPKSEEATALKHRHDGDITKAKNHFTKKLASSFAEANRICKPNCVIAIMFAHQSTEAWSALINALFKAGLTVTATYPIDTELTSALKKNMSALASSITVICRVREVGVATSFRDVRREIDVIVAKSVHRFFEYGLRGADLIVACYGPAVGVFGKYERVERADGTPVEIPELLALVRESALKAIAGEFEGDNLSRLYFVWANLYGVGEQAWDDARLIVQIGGEEESAMEVARNKGIFEVDGSTVRLALLADRVSRHHLGEDIDDPLIDQLHHAMHLWQLERRSDLVEFLRNHELADNEPFWKLAQALWEVLPRGEVDWKLISALLGERETLRKEVRRIEKPQTPEQGRLFD